MSDAQRAPRAEPAPPASEPQGGPHIGPEERASLFGRYGRRFSAGESLVREGTPAKETLLVHEGRVRLFRRVSMTERTLAVLRPGDLFGEGALLEGATYGSTAIALSDGAVLALDRATFRSLLVRYPDVATRVVEQLVRRLRSAEDQIEIMMLRGVQSKVAGALVKLVTGPNGISSDAAVQVHENGAAVTISPVELAMRVGLDVDVVRRSIQRLRDRQYLRVLGERIEIADVEALRRLYLLLGTKDELAGRSSDM
jgi:CRP-like cAMP-binding protein